MICRQARRPILAGKRRRHQVLDLVARPHLTHQRGMMVQQKRRLVHQMARQRLNRLMAELAAARKVVVSRAAAKAAVVRLAADKEARAGSRRSTL